MRHTRVLFSVSYICACRARDGAVFTVFNRCLRIYDQAALASKVAGAESGPEFLTPWGNTFYELEVGALSCYGPTRRSPAPWPVHAGAPF